MFESMVTFLFLKMDGYEPISMEASPASSTAIGKDSESLGFPRITGESYGMCSEEPTSEITCLTLVTESKGFDSVMRPTSS
jgi:hypothetical protein